MADLTPGELAKIDQIHAGITNKLAELVSSAVDGIRTEGEALTASALAGTAQATDHNSVSALLAASLVLNARYQMADEKRHTAKREDTSTLTEALSIIGEYIDNEQCWLDHHGYCQNHRLSDTSEGVGCVNVRAHRILGTKPEVTGNGHVG